MKPAVSDTMLRDAVVSELERDPDVAATHVSVHSNPTSPAPTSSRLARSGHRRIT
jgi:hypothetical protein